LALIEWSDGLSVNVQEIDGEHKRLVKTINELNQAMRERKGKEALGGIVSTLADYAVTHFATEEMYFDKYLYPQREGHKTEHRAFVAKVSDFQKEYESGKIALSVEVMNFLSGWLADHIIGSDKKYSSFLNERGVR